MVNFSDELRTITLQEPAGSLLLATQPGAEISGEQLSLPPHTAVVIAPAGE